MELGNIFFASGETLETIKAAGSKVTLKFEVYTTADVEKLVQLQNRSIVNLVKNGYESFHEKEDMLSDRVCV